MHRSLSIIVITAALAGAAWAASAGADQVDKHGAGNALVGTWEYTITQETPSSPLPTKGVLTLARDGGVINVDQRAVAGPGKATAGLGRWELVRPGSLRLKFVEFLAGPNGSVLTLTLRGTVELNEDRAGVVGTGAFQLTNDAGAVLVAGTNTIHGVRMSAA